MRTPASDLRTRLLVLAALCHLAAQAPGDVIFDWNTLVIDAVRSDNSGPTLSSRNLAIVHTAVYDSVNSIARTHQPYRFQLDPPPGASSEAAAVGAARTTVKALYPSFSARADALAAIHLNGWPPGAAVSDGLALGERIAQLTLQSRQADGSQTEVPYIPDDTPGNWRRTPPFFRPPVAPHWRFVQPFCVPNTESFLPPPPPALDSPEYAEALNQVQIIGGKDSIVRTDEQTQIAVFWSDFSYTSMPPGHWHDIAQTIARNQNNSLLDNVRLFALISLAQADGAIVSWEAKYRYNLWRPVTAIQRADEDDNPQTHANKTWEQLLPSPAFPSYVSGHSTFSKASAQVLTRFYGADAITFTAASDSLPDVFRTFHSLAACADEIGLSRIYGGFHFSFDDVYGKFCGQQIGDYVSANFLLPNDLLPFVRLEAVEDNTAVVRVHGHSGTRYILEASPDLRAWRPVATNLATAGGILIRASRASVDSRQFYRALEKSGAE